VEEEGIMPFGAFLDNFPAALFVAAHVLMLGLGVWAMVRTRGRSVAISTALLLYVISQPVFFAYWAGLITLKMTAVAEQTLIMLMVVWIVLGLQRDSSRPTSAP
jgi:hypothetical protein